MSDHQGRSDGPDIPIADQQFSVHVSRTLDCLGKSQDIIKYRVKTYRESQRLANILYSDFVLIIAGSKGEGLTSNYESDHDYMIVDTEVICSDNAHHFINKSHDVVFQTERHKTPAGYTKLKLIQCNDDSPVIKDSLYQDENGNRYLSSDFFMTFMKNEHMHFEEFEDMKGLDRSGPSLPTTNFRGTTFTDIVPAFCCVCPDLLNAFLARPRLYNRPDKTILNDISKLEGHVVSVGCKGSETLYQEWRICFTKAEIRLINSFNDIETKLYILLKMVSKIVKTVSTDITSYVMKNVVLWSIELNPVCIFTEKLLTTRLTQALVFLNKCVEINFLPSYMIKERNLLPRIMDPLQKHKLTSYLNKLIQEGGNVLMRCEKLQIAMLIMYREPGMAEHFRLLRNLVEKLYLFKNIMTLEKQLSADLSAEHVEQLFLTHKTYIKMQRVLLYCLVPEWRVLIRLGFSLYYVRELLLERSVLLYS